MFMVKCFPPECLMSSLPQPVDGEITICPTDETIDTEVT